jgi:hypothetical protein
VKARAPRSKASTNLRERPTWVRQAERQRLGRNHRMVQNHLPVARDSLQVTLVTFRFGIERRLITSGSRPIDSEPSLKRTSTISCASLLVSDAAVHQSSTMTIGPPVPHLYSARHAPTPRKRSLCRVRHQPPFVIVPSSAPVTLLLRRRALRAPRGCLVRRDVIAMRPRLGVARATVGP